jgi:hypothetical protein
MCGDAPRVGAAPRLVFPWWELRGSSEEA